MGLYIIPRLSWHARIVWNDISKKRNIDGYISHQNFLFWTNLMAYVSIFWKIKIKISFLGKNFVFLGGFFFPFLDFFPFCKILID